MTNETEAARLDEYEQDLKHFYSDRFDVTSQVHEDFINIRRALRLLDLVERGEYRVVPSELTKEMQNSGVGYLTGPISPIIWMAALSAAPPLTEILGGE